MLVLVAEQGALERAQAGVAQLGGLAKLGAAMLLSCSLEERPFKREAMVASMLDVERNADTVFANVMQVLPQLEGHPRRPILYMLALDLEDAVDQAFAAAIQLVNHTLPQVPEGGVQLVAAAVAQLDHLAEALNAWCKDGGLPRARWHAQVAHKVAMDADVEFVSHLADVLTGPMEPEEMARHREFLDGVRHLLHLVDDAAVVLASPEHRLTGAAAQGAPRA